MHAVSSPITWLLILPGLISAEVGGTCAAAMLSPAPARVMAVSFNSQFSVGATLFSDVTNGARTVKLRDFARGRERAVAVDPTTRAIGLTDFGDLLLVDEVRGLGHVSLPAGHFWEGRVPFDARPSATALPGLRGGGGPVEFRIWGDWVIARFRQRVHLWRGSAYRPAGTWRAYRHGELAIVEQKKLLLVPGAEGLAELDLSDVAPLIRRIPGSPLRHFLVSRGGAWMAGYEGTQTAIHFFHGRTFQFLFAPREGEFLIPLAFSGDERSLFVWRPRDRRVYPFDLARRVFAGPLPFIDADIVPLSGSRVLGRTSSGEVAVYDLDGRQWEVVFRGPAGSEVSNVRVDRIRRRVFAVVRSGEEGGRLTLLGNYPDG